jgi:hypothetical protein
MRVKMRQMPDPNTGRVLEVYPFSDEFGAVLQEALDRGLLEYAGTNADGKPIYRCTNPS